MEKRNYNWEQLGDNIVQGQNRGVSWLYKKPETLRKSIEGRVLYDNPDMSYDNPNCKSNYIKGPSPKPKINKDDKTIITRSGRELKPPTKCNDFVKSCLYNNL